MVVHRSENIGAPYHKAVSALFRTKTKMRHIFSLDVQLSESVKYTEDDKCYTAKMLYVA